MFLEKKKYSKIRVLFLEVGFGYTRFSKTNNLIVFYNTRTLSLMNRM